MSEQLHSPEPWRVDSNSGGYADIWADGVQVVDGRQMRGGELLEVNAARAVACVNALSGVRNPEAVPMLLSILKEMHAPSCPCPICTAFRELDKP